jgi:hypothetical protein
MEKLEVLSPVGLAAVSVAGGAPRLGDLNGKKVAEFWNGVFKGDVAFPIIRRLLRQRYPAVEIIPYSEFPHSPGSDKPALQRERARHMAALAQQKGAHAVIAGIGA